MNSLARRFVVLTLGFSALAYAQLENPYLRECDTQFKALEDKTENQNMIDRDQLVNSWAECWKRSLEKELDKRLLLLKKKNPGQFKKEMGLQKAFNQAVGKLCGKNCGSEGTMKGLPYNSCRVEAYKYRAAQVKQINMANLTTPTSADWPLSKADKEKGKAKETATLKEYVVQFCGLPKDVWKNGTVPKDCITRATQELDTLEFTDNPCDLS